MYKRQLNRNLHNQVISNVTDCDVTFAEAFTVDRDMNARDPNKNFLDIVPSELMKQPFDVLVLHSGPNEISNLDTSASYVDNIRSWQLKVQKTQQTLFTLAKQCLEIFPSLKRVVIVKQIPRYDSYVKAHLSRFANNVLEDLWMKDGGNKIVVAGQDLECDCLLYTSPSPRD